MNPVLILILVVGFAAFALKACGFIPWFPWFWALVSGACAVGMFCAFALVVIGSRKNR